MDNSKSAKDEEVTTEEYFNYQETKALKKAKIKIDVNKFSDCKTGFMIQNKKTERIVEIKAPSVEIAALLVGWRLRHTVLVKKVNY